MKIKTALISIVVSAALVAGAGYGAYHIMQGKKSPVEVVPVSNVNTGGYWGMDESIYGSVTSQIAQNITLDEEYPVAEIYVEVGDQVQEGTPLFSYDMTLQELELEMEQLTLQVYELTMTKLEKDLQKLKQTPATASLELDSLFMTTASDEVLLIEEMEVLEAPENAAGSEQVTENNGDSKAEEFEDIEAESAQEEVQNDSSGEQDGNDEKPEDGNLSGESAGDSVQIENIETMEMSEEEKERLAVLDAATTYEQVVTAVDSLFRAYGTDLNSEDISEAIKEAHAYYLRHLAEEQSVSVTDENGDPAEQKVYVIRKQVQEALGEDGTLMLQKYSELLEQYQIKCVEMMISEAALLDGETLSEAVKQVEEFFAAISTEGQKEVDNIGQLTELKNRTAVQEYQTEESEYPGSEETGNSEVEDQTEAESAETISTDTISETMTETEMPDVITDVLVEDVLSEGNYDAQPLEESESGEQGETAAETEAQNETGSDPAGESESSAESETQSETASESETEQYYTVEVQSPGSANVSEAAEGDLVVLHTEAEIPGTEFAGWTAETWTVLSDGTASEYSVIDPSLLVNLEPIRIDTSFIMPAMNVKLIPNYRIVPSEIDGFITNFEELAGKVTAEGASESSEYVTMLGDAIDFYQQWLAEVPAEILDETTGKPSMEQYQMKSEVKEYLMSQNRENEIEKLQNSYKEICKAYVKVLVENLDPHALTREAWNKASEAYLNLGITWQTELEEVWMLEQQEKLEQAVQNQTEAQTESEEPADEEGMEEDESEEDNSYNENTGAAVQTPLSIAELLLAYDMILIIQELDFTKAEELLRLDLMTAHEKYMTLTEAQQQVVWNAYVLIDALKSYDMWEQQETEMPAGDDFGFDGGGFDDFAEGYTASELKMMIEEKEQEIKECDLSIRESELIVKQCQRIVDGKVVKSTMEGTVVSIGDLDGNSEGEYFAKVTNEEGLYARGAMNELALETIKVGDRISGMMLDTGVSFTAVIKEISQYPSADSDSMYYGYGTENTNASYYPFYALLDDTTDIEEGEAEIQLSETMTSAADAIYLEKYFVRSDNTGKSYVFIQGEDGKLKKQYVTTGKLMYGFALEISSGLKMSDKIAFPYGNDVFEGAATKEVDMLSAYM